MRIFTSYYGNLKNIPTDYFIVAGSLSVSDEILHHVDIQEKLIAPSSSIFSNYKQDKDWNIYVERFKTEILPNIDWLEYLEKWEELASKNGKTLDNIVICCYEHPDEYCHRHILSEHIETEFKTKVLEYGYEKYVRNNYKLTLGNNMDILF